MCTAITFESEDFFFGRTLDYERSFGEEVVLTPRLFPLPFRHVPDPGRHFAILGMALVSDEYPLYYDAMNEHGLCMAGLNFVGSARYGNPGTDKVAPFELIPWVLGRCTCAEEARTLLADTALVEEDFSNSLPCARLHWIIADRSSWFPSRAIASSGSP
jgi:choloylglycine hydrolase